MRHGIFNDKAVLALCKLCSHPKIATSNKFEINDQFITYEILMKYVFDLKVKRQTEPKEVTEVLKTLNQSIV